VGAADSRAEEASHHTLPVHRPHASSPPSSHRTVATSAHLDALTLITRFPLLEICRVAVQVAQRQCEVDPHP
jgi:hypothetical protein